MLSRSKNKLVFNWYDPILFMTLIPLLAIITKLLLSSYRLINVKGEEMVKEVLSRSGGKAVYASWHQRLIFHARYFANSGLTVMVSQSRDGEYAVRLANCFGFNTVRGSSTRGGPNALKELTQKIERYAIGGMVVDGPLGPARIAKIGALIIARNAHAPLIPVVWGADRCWVINSWDRLIVPKPFAKIVFCYGDPIIVKYSANGKDLEIYRQTLEDRLNQSTRWCDEQFGKERPWRKTKDKGVPEIGPIGRD